MEKPEEVFIINGNENLHENVNMENFSYGGLWYMKYCCNNTDIPSYQNVIVEKARKTKNKQKSTIGLMDEKVLLVP